MKSYIILSVLVGSFLLAAVSSCATKNEQSTEATEEIETLAPTAPDMSANSRNSLDWDGSYQGTTPCADCEGIETTIILEQDGTFKRSLKYLGKDDQAFEDEGIFEWNDAGSKITLPGEAGMSQMYQVGENVLFHLDQEGNRITGDLAALYRLEKQ